MALEVGNRGRGFIGDIAQNWRLAQNGSPVIMGQQPGRLGSLSFTAGCDTTTKFTIDNYLSVRHFADDQITRWLSTFDGYVRGVDPSHTGFASFTMNSVLSALDVQRVSHTDVSGKYQRLITLPVNKSYVANSVTYYTGGFYRGSEFIPQSISIYDICSDEDYIYVLASGGHSGEVVFRIGFDGIFNSVWPVYSDATDLASPQSRFIAYGGGSVYVGQVAADRVKRFGTNGTFTSQWGSAGTGNSQFGTISGIAANDSGGDRVFVTDSALGRVQAFNLAGTYQTQWGTSGTGTGNTVFNQPNGVSVDHKTGNVFVSDINARVREYTSTGTYVTQPMGSYNFSNNTSTGEFIKTSTIAHAFDQRGNAYAIQEGVITKYIRGSSSWVDSSRAPVKSWNSRGIGDATKPKAIASHWKSGVIHVARSNDVIEQWGGSLGNIEAHVLYYVALAAEDFPVRLLSMNDDMVAGARAYIEWDGNVWDHLCQFAAATGNSIAAFDNRVIFTARGSLNYTLPHTGVGISPLQIDSRGAGRSIEIVNQNSRWNTNNREVMYSAAKDGGKIFSVDVAAFATYTVSQDTYPEFLANPSPSNTMGDGLYTVVDSQGVLIQSSVWNSNGGYVKARVGDKPGQIYLTISGPNIEIPNTDPPYRIATSGGQASLTIVGTGIIAQPETYRIGTGLSEQITNREVAQTIDYPFAMNAQIAYTQGGWAAYDSGTPNQKITFTLPLERSYAWSDNGTVVTGAFQFVNTVIRYQDAEYIVEECDLTATQITLSCYRYTRVGRTVGETVGPRQEEIWNGRNVDEFDAFWAGYTSQDFTMAPLRNPFGV